MAKEKMKQIKVFTIDAKEYNFFYSAEEQKESNWEKRKVIRAEGKEGNIIILKKN